MFEISADKIASCLTYGTLKNFHASEKIKIKKIATNHKECTKNSVFVAIKGPNFDGHKFARLAIENGAEFAVVEEELPKIAQIVVNNCKNALLDLASLNRQNFFGPVIAITGSAGKTTTKDLTALALSGNENILKTEQNLNNEIGVSQTLLNLNSFHKAAVVELGMSHKNEISTLSQATKPNIAIITTIGSAHFKNFKNHDEILKAKLEIIDGLQPNGTLILNGDDPRLNQVNFKNKLICSVNDTNADFFADKITSNNNPNNPITSFKVHFNGRSTKIDLPTYGVHNVSNALLAFAAATILGIAPEEIAQNLTKFKPAGYRQKILKLNHTIVIADCYNANPQTMKASLLAFSNMNCTGKKIAVLGDMLELGSIAKQAHEEIGTLINTLNIDQVACIGDLAEIISKTTTKPANHFKSANQLVDFLKQQKNKFKMFLFKASHDMNLKTIMEQTFENEISKPV